VRDKLPNKVFKAKYAKWRLALHSWDPPPGETASATAEEEEKAESQRALSFAATPQSHDQNEDIYKCYVCEKAFSGFEALEKHEMESENCSSWDSVVQKSGAQLNPEADEAFLEELDLILAGSNESDDDEDLH